MTGFLHRQSIRVAILFVFLGAFCPTSLAKTIYVSPDSIPDGSGTTWETAFNSISAGLTASASGDEIWVQAATYYEAIKMQAGVALYGGFTGQETTQEDRDYTNNKTIIDASDLNTSVVIGADNAILDGFTITGGFSYNGGGLYCTSASPTLNNCIITDNTAYYRHSYHSIGGLGGGIYCKNSSPILNGCIITNNTADFLNRGSESSYGGSGGGLYCKNSSSILNNCIISYNTVSSFHSFPSIDFQEEYYDGCGGGVYCSQSSPTLNNCRISENSTDFGGGLYIESMSSPFLYNCIIDNNEAYYVDYPDGMVDFVVWGVGGGLYCTYNSSASLINCTITGNLAGYEKGSIKGPATLTNSILWNNTSIRGSINPNYIEAIYSCIENRTPSDGNIRSDPLFVDATAGNYRLQAGSPCIDAGSPDVSFNDGCLPPGLGGVRNDMGAYGGPGNCLDVAEIPTPTFTPTETATPTNTPTPTSTPTPTFTPLPGQPKIWILDGQGTVQLIE